MPCSMAFLPMVITISTGGSMLGHLVVTLLEWFQNNIRNFEMVCYRTVPEQTFFSNSSRKVLEACSRTCLKQTIRIFL